MDGIPLSENWVGAYACQRVPPLTSASLRDVNPTNQPETTAHCGLLIKIDNHIRGKRMNDHDAAILRHCCQCDALASEECSPKCRLYRHSQRIFNETVSDIEMEIEDVTLGGRIIDEGR